jgi:hypothetical protein
MYKRLVSHCANRILIHNRFERIFNQSIVCRQLLTDRHNNTCDENEFLFTILQQSNVVQKDRLNDRTDLGSPSSSRTAVDHPPKLNELTLDQLARLLDDHNQSADSFGAFSTRLLFQKVEREVRDRLEKSVKVTVQDLDDYFGLFRRLRIRLPSNRLHQLICRKSLATKYFLVDKQRFLITCFLLNLIRNEPPNTFKFVAEQYAQQLIRTNQLHVHEIALITSAFFKTQTRLTSKTVVILIDFLLKNRNELTSSIAAGCIFKGIRYCQSIVANDQLKRFVKEFTLSLPTYDFKAALQLQLICKQHKCFDDDLQKYLMSAIMRYPPDQIRIKDIDRCLRSMTFFNVMPDDNFLNFVENWLINSSQSFDFPLSFVSSLADLAIYDRFPEKLIHFLFSAKMFGKVSS